LKNWNFLYLTLFTALLIMGCSRLRNKKKNALAKYQDEYLYLEDVQDQLKSFVSPEDSINQVKNIINTWLKYQTLLGAADKNLGDSAPYFNQLLEDYKNSLYIYHYESQQIAKNLDTVVTDSLIKKYYDLNAGNFELKRNIVKIWYAKFPKAFVQVKEVLPYFKNANPNSLGYVNEFCTQYASNHFVSNTEWLYFDEIGKEIPLDPLYDQLKFIQNNKYKEFTDDNYLYVLSIIDYKVKNNVSPLEMVYPQIKQMIINERKVSLLNKNQGDLLKKAIEKGDAKIL